MHISSPQRRSWLAERMETLARDAAAGERPQRACSQLLINAEQFERFCHTKYPGTKRFSLEGSESLIPLLDLVLTHAARLGAIEAVLGMAHRGRLSDDRADPQAPERANFRPVRDVEPEKALGGGDVKYHLGYSNDRIDPNGNAIHVSLAFNPSHLEAVDPVVVGRVRAKQTRHSDVEIAASSACSSTATRRSRGRASCPRRCSCRAAGVSHRRHGPHHRQQPGRLHRVARRAALDAVLHRRREDARVPDLARQRRGSRRARARRRRSRASTARSSSRRRDRHVRLSQVRPQRERRAGVHAAAHVRAQSTKESPVEVYTQKLVGDGVDHGRAGREDDAASRRRARGRARRREEREASDPRARR